MTTVKKQRITGIEVLRIPLILIAFLGHWHFAPMALNAHLATNMFFIIAGFFMFKSLEKNGNGPAIKKLYFHIMPPVVVAGIVWDLLCHIPMTSMVHNMAQRLFLLDGTIGNVPLMGCPVAWFINVYFWAFVFWAGMRKLWDKNFIIINAAIVFLGYIYLSQTGFQTAVGNPSFAFGGLLNLPFIRGITFIGLGMLLSHIKLPIHSFITRSVLQCGALAYLIYVLFIGWAGDKTMLTFILAAGAILLLLVENNDLVSNTLNKTSNKITYLSRYTLYIYIFMIVGMNLAHYPSVTTASAGLQALGISIVCSIIYYHLQQLLKHLLLKPQPVHEPPTIQNHQ